MNPRPDRRAEDRHARVVARIHQHEEDESFLESMLACWHDVKPKIIRILAITLSLALLAVLTLRHG